jgi:hypothetical protein
MSKWYKLHFNILYKNFRHKSMGKDTLQIILVVYTHADGG